MAKSADIGSKRLIGLAPTKWARWVTSDDTVTALELIAGEFQWVARANDVLIKVQSPQQGTFLVANEIQLRPDPRIGKRIRAYAALGEEKYDLKVYPVVINILPLPLDVELVTSYDSELMGIKAHQDFRVINLWEVDASLVFKQNLVTLLPFVPILKGGDSEAVIAQAVVKLRASKKLAEMEALLAFFARFVLSPTIVRNIMRWDMEILRESPWYNEILQEGVELGLEQERRRVLLNVIRHRFGQVPPKVEVTIQRFTLEQMDTAMNSVLDAQSLEEAVQLIAKLAEPAPKQRSQSRTSKPK